MKPMRLPFSCLVSTRSTTLCLPPAVAMRLRSCVLPRAHVAACSFARLIVVVRRSSCCTLWRQLRCRRCLTDATGAALCCAKSHHHGALRTQFEDDIVARIVGSRSAPSTGAVGVTCRQGPSYAANAAFAACSLEAQHPPEQSIWPFKTSAARAVAALSHKSLWSVAIACIRPPALLMLAKAGHSGTTGLILAAAHPGRKLFRMGVQPTQP